MTAPYIPLPVVESRPDPGPFADVLFVGPGIKLTTDVQGFLLHANGAMRHLDLSVARELAEAILAAIPEGEDAHA